MRIFSSGRAGRPPPDAAVCQGQREDRRSHNNETVILLTKTIEWFIVLLKHITYLALFPNVPAFPVS